MQYTCACRLMPSPAHVSDWKPKSLISYLMGFRFVLNGNPGSLMWGGIVQNSGLHWKHVKSEHPGRCLQVLMTPWYDAAIPSYLTCPQVVQVGFDIGLRRWHPWFRWAVSDNICALLLCCDGMLCDGSPSKRSRCTGENAVRGIAH